MLVKRTARVPEITPWRELEDLPQRFVRMLQGPFFPEFPAAPTTFLPPVDIAEKETELLITAELPGMKKEEVEIRIEEGVLTIKGEKKEEKEEKTPRMHVWERNYGIFERAFTLPRYVELEKVQAEFKNGVLIVHVPKVEQIKGKKVEIQAK
jgi:HSP20 family protein